MVPGAVAQVDRRARGRPEIRAPPVVGDAAPAVHPEGVDRVGRAVVAPANDAAFLRAAAAWLDESFDRVLRGASRQVGGCAKDVIVARGAIKIEFVVDFEDNARSPRRQRWRRRRAGRRRRRGRRWMRRGRGHYDVAGDCPTPSVDLRVAAVALLRLHRARPRDTTTIASELPSIKIPADEVPLA
eukprot:7391567-Prymnesium_polylepis.10